MALRVEYLIRETGTNLWRNVWLTVAAVLTVFVCLALFGVSILVGKGADSLTSQWKGGIEFIIFMKPAATPDEDTAIRKVLDESGSEIKSYKYLDQAAAYEEFKKLFADKQELIDSISQNVLPPSYRVVPVDNDADAIAQLGKQFEDKPGVYEVRYASETLRNLESLTNLVRIGLLAAALILLAVAVLLILNTTFTAMMSRRREIEVMKLVGATNWFIRIPYMLEGLVHGLVGAAGAAGVLVGVNKWLFPKVQRINLFEYFRVTSGEVWSTSLMLLAIGCLVGVIGSTFAVWRYLDV
ncbi:MAG: FtsX-like permease family protein [Actinobacteria bacterium]|uniref:Cell division protein FtsX n=1 Tax=freshwater metagenome TaxID=449393 RepID=A0A6J7PEY1_9ZZZZ|nr:FtsX-like permease family protein [Actinomycetota bacterium]